VVEDRDMIVLTIEDVPPWDGKYEFEDFSFTQRELYTIKQLSGIRAGELVEALDANDSSAMVGIAVVILARNDIRVDVDDLWASTVGSLRLDIVADEELPPTQGKSKSATTSLVDSSGSNTEADSA